MKSVPFSNGWTCRHLQGEGPGVPVLIPHDAMLTEARGPENASGINGSWFEGHDYLYEKTFTPDPSWAGKTLLLELEGVYRKAEVWLNGEKLAFRPYGYINFYVDLTGKLKEGENALRVIARNADQPNSRWYSGAGIYRPVVLHILPSRHLDINGVKISTLDWQKRTVKVVLSGTEGGQAQVDILDGGTVLASGAAELSGGKGELTLTVEGARLWSPEDPRLYTCRVTFGEDVREVPFGIRCLTWGKEGICLNGQRVILRGACIHHDNGLLGAACWPDAVERKVRLLRAAGYNAVRSAHNPCSKALLDVCDRLGVLVMDEYVDHWYIHKNKYDYVEFFEAWWKQDLKDMVEKDFNHPCVILYSTGNEVSETAEERGIRLTGEMTKYLHGLDPSRPVTCGVNIFFNFLSSIGFGQYSDKKAEAEAARAEKAKAQGKAVKEKAVGSKFFNDLAGLLGDEFMKRGATLPPCDWRTRDAFANMDIAGYNYGIYRYKHDLKKYPDRLILGSETFCNDAYRFWEQAKAEPRLVGDFVWAGIDYLGEVGIGAWEYGDYAPRFDGGPGWISAGSGRLDLTGRELGEALYTKVAFELEPGPRIAVRPVDHTGHKHSPSAWKMTNAVESWSWNGCDGSKADVEVYVRAAAVELFINGESVGKKNAKDDCVFSFRVTYRPGTVEAVAYDAAGKEIGRSALTSGGEETQLRAEPEEASVEPGHLCYVRLRYTDAGGITKPLERGLIKVEVKGGKLMGLGSACPYYERSYLSDTADTYYGEALAVVLAGDGGAVELSAGDGVHSAKAAVPIL